VSLYNILFQQTFRYIYEYYDVVGNTVLWRWLHYGSDFYRRRRAKLPFAEVRRCNSELTANAGISWLKPAAAEAGVRTQTSAKTNDLLAHLAKLRECRVQARGCTSSE